MAEKFDPYHHWLGIPPDDQPPNHYRLLGLRAFEDSLDVIETAADRQMMYLRSFQTGRHAALSQQLLNEVSAARVCLLNRKTKVAYDVGLHQRMASQTASAGATPLPPQTQDAAIAGWMEQTGDPISCLPRTSRKRATEVGPLIGLGVAALALIVMIVIWSTSSRKQTSGELARHGAPRPTASETPGKPEPKPLPASPRPNVPDKAALVAGVGEGFEDQGPSGRKGKGKKNRKPRPKFMPGAGIEDVPNGLSPMDPSVLDPNLPPLPSLPTVTTPATKLPEPDRAAQDKAQQLAQEVYKNDFELAQTPLQRVTLARKLFQAASATQNDPASQFVLWKLARELATESCDGLLAFEVVERMAAAYDVDATAMKLDVLSRFSRKARTLDDYNSIADQARRLAEKSLAEGNLKLAEQLAEVGLSTARKSETKLIIKPIAMVSKQVKEAVAAVAAVEKAEAVLKDKPDDPEANFVAGRFLCLFQDQWEQGVPLLVKGSDDRWKAVARQELTPPSVPEEQIKLADAWWELSQGGTDRDREGLALHAGDWYSRARNALPEGLLKAKADKQLQEIRLIERRAPIVRQSGAGR